MRHGFGVTLEEEGLVLRERMRRKIDWWRPLKKEMEAQRRKIKERALHNGEDFGVLSAFYLSGLF